MKKVGCPDNGLTRLEFYLMRNVTTGGEECSHKIFVTLVVRRIGRQSEIEHIVIRQTVCARIHDERPALHIDALECHPNATHIVAWYAMKMQRIAVGGLFRARIEIEGLKWDRPAPVEHF